MCCLKKGQSAQFQIRWWILIRKSELSLLTWLIILGNSSLSKDYQYWSCEICTIFTGMGGCPQDKLHQCITLVPLLFPVLVAPLKVGFWNHQQIFYCTVFSCFHVIKCFAFQGLCKFREQKKSQETISGDHGSCLICGILLLRPSLQKKRMSFFSYTNSHGSNLAETY
jgi:hypothetical protein